MGMWKQLGRRIAYLAHRGRFHRELDDEIRFHLEVRAAELERQGFSPADARAAAQSEFGTRAWVGEESRAVWRSRWLEDLFTDLRHAARFFARSRVFTITALACLALGIGANTLIFSLVDAILLHPLPYPNSDRIVMVRFTPPDQPDQRLGSNSGTYFFIRDHSTVFERTGALRITGFSVTEELTGDAPRDWLLGGWASPGLVDVMGVNPVLGRWFPEGDYGPDTVISYRLWQRMFGGSRDVIGKQLRSDLGTRTIVGVAPAGFQTLNPDLDFWFLQPDTDLARARRSPNRVFSMFARMKPGVSVEQAQAQVTALLQPLSRELEMNRDWGIKVETLQDAYVGHLRRPLLLFQGAVFFLLLIACANVGALMLAQATSRNKELSVKAALGCSRGRVIRQLLAESLLLAVLGGVLGIGIAWLGLRAVAETLPTLLPTYATVSLNLTVLGFSLLLSLATGLIFGALPALQVSRTDLMTTLRESAGRVTAGAGQQRLHSSFVVVQVALAVVLLAGSALLTNSLLRLNLVRPGLEPHGLMTFQTPFPRTLYRPTGSDPRGGLQVEYSPEFNQLNDRLRARIAQVPGVTSVALAMTPPMGGEPHRLNFSEQGHPLTDQEREAWSAEWYPVSPDYFRTLRVPILQGREFEEADRDTGRRVVVINATMARRFFPNENPIGRLIQVDMTYDPPREIVGVVGDVRQNRYSYQPQAQMYVPRAQLPAKLDMTLSLDLQTGTFVVRSGGDPDALVPALRRAVAEVSPSQTVMNVLTVEQYAAGQLTDLRHYAALLSIFGGLSVLLSIVGLSGIMVHGVQQRRNEIGVRVALGARSSSVLSLIARQGLALTGIGILIGLVLSLIVTRVLSGFLWGVKASDPLTFASVIATMTAVALVACFLPARRALKIDPAIALKSE